MRQLREAHRTRRALLRRDFRRLHQRDVGRDVVLGELRELGLRHRHRLDAELRKARLAGLGVEPMPMDPQQFAKFLHDDIEGQVSLVKAAKIPTQ